MSLREDRLANLATVLELRTPVGGGQYYQDGRNDAAAIRSALKELNTLRARIATLTSGPYTAEPCRGHWHVRSGGAEIITDAGSILDEATAKDQAERMNANYNQSIEKREDENRVLLARIATLEAELEAANKHVEILNASREEYGRERAKIQRAIGNVCLAFHDWPEYTGTEYCQAERRNAINDLAETAAPTAPA